MYRFRYILLGLVLGGMTAWAGSNSSILAEVSAALGVNNAIRQILHIGDTDGIEATEHTVRDIDGTASALDVGTLSVTIDGDFAVNGSMDELQFTTGLTAPTHSEGLIFYDDNEKTLAVYNNESDVTLQLGLELYKRATNNTGITITNGQVVYVSGALGNRSVVSLAKADSPSTARVIAMATHDTDDNSIGFFTTFGQVNDVNTASDTAGTEIYLSATTAGAWTSTPPTEPNFRILIGTIARQNANDGKIDLSIGPTDVVDHMIIQSLALNDSLNVAGDVTYTGGGGLQAGGISVIDNTNATTLNSAAKVQITGFDTNDPSNGSVSPDHASDHIIIGKGGYYLISASVVARNNAAQTHDIEINGFTNGGTNLIGSIHAHRTLAGGITNAGSISLGTGGYIFTAGDSLELWATTDFAGDRSVTFEDLVMTVFQVGGTP